MIGFMATNCKWRHMMAAAVRVALVVAVAVVLAEAVTGGNRYGG